MLPNEKQSIPISQIQHKESASLLLGCGNCHLKTSCGGLQLDGSVVHCLDFCSCEDPNSCDVVCSHAPQRFVQRLNEVEGFGLDGIELKPAVAWPRLPVWLPIIEKPMLGLNMARIQFGVLPINAACKRTADGLVALTASELNQKFGGTPTGGWVLTGVDQDYRIEQIWRLGRAGRERLFAGLKASGVVAATSPNFSLIADVPRSDNLHARKRIGIVWSEMNRVGLPTALHVNARNQADFDFYAELIKGTGCRTISFEFATGAGASEAMDRYLTRLARLAADIPWPLSIFVRGGVHRYETLHRIFETVTQLDTNAHMKARKRQTLVPATCDRRHRWITDPSVALLPVGEIFQLTMEQCRQVDRLARQSPKLSASPRISRLRVAQVDLSANDESPQLRLAF